VKTLPDVLHEAMRLIDDHHESVVIERGQSHEPLDGRSEAFQLRLDRGSSQYTCEMRSWLGARWSSWREHHGWLGGPGFDIRDVLADDWRILCP